jgi:hypothetical protein
LKTCSERHKRGKREARERHREAKERQERGKKEARERQE